MPVVPLHTAPKAAEPFLFDSSKVLFTSFSIHQRFCSHPFQFIKGFVHILFNSSKVLFTSFSIHQRFCSHPFQFIKGFVHILFNSSKVLFTSFSIHQRFCSHPFQFIKGFVHRNQDDIKVENALLWRHGGGGGGGGGRGCSMFMALLQIDKEPKENNETSKVVNAWVKSIKTKEMLTFIQYDVHCSTSN